MDTGRQEFTDPPPSYEAARTEGSQPQSTDYAGNSAGGQAASSSTAAPAESSSGNNSNRIPQRDPQRHNSSSEELDLEQEDRPLPPGWVPQYSEEHDRESRRILDRRRTGS